MSKNTSVALGDHFSDFIKSRIEAGRYQNASDVVRSGLRLLEEHETRLSRLQQALIDGENSGPPSAFDFEAFRASKREPYET